MGQVLPQSFQKDQTLLTPQFPTSILQNCGTINFSFLINCHPVDGNFYCIHKSLIHLGKVYSSWISKGTAWVSFLTLALKTLRCSPTYCGRVGTLVAKETSGFCGSWPCVFPVCTALSPVTSWGCCRPLLCVLVGGSIGGFPKALVSCRQTSLWFLQTTSVCVRRAVIRIPGGNVKETLPLGKEVVSNPVNTCY